MLLYFLFQKIHCDPFGIDPSLSEVYRQAINQANNSFTCLDQSMTIPLSSLNDGKCDCPDSSDEPGTSACLNGHFYCHNLGAKAKKIPSHQVNDGICDCCDGSDEFDNPNAQCPNICADLVTMSHDRRDSIYQKIRAGIRRKKESIKETATEFPQSQRELRELRQEQARFEHELDLLNRKKREKKKVWKWEKRAAKGVTPEMYAEKKRRKNEYINKPKKQEEVEEEPDPNGLNVPYDEDLGTIDWNVDEGIEELIFHATPRPTPIRRDNVFGRDHHHDDMHDDRKHKRENKWKEMRKSEKERTATGQEAIGFLEKARKKVQELTGKVFGGDKPKSYEEYMEVEKEIEQLSSASTDVRIQIMHLQDRFKHDLGPDNLWWPLSEKVFEKSKDGNDYKLTIFGPLMHRQTGAAWYGTAYGQFSGFNATGRTMLYEGGQMCWEGDPRRTEFYLYCGPNDKFLDMEEIDRCVYKGHFETPLVCSEEYLEWVKGLSDMDLTDYIAQWEMIE